jgi:hypothetical protein
MLGRPATTQCVTITSFSRPPTESASGDTFRLGRLAEASYNTGCTREGLYYEYQGESFSIKLPDRDLDVLDTNVSIRSL